MPVSVLYNNIEFKNGINPIDVLNIIKRDVSWGTWDESLTALDMLKISDKYRRFEPNIPTQAAVPEEKKFNLLLEDEQFNLDSEGIDHFVATLAGDILLNPKINKITVDDISFNDDRYYDFFKGPNVGVHGVYKMLAKTINTVNRPILAFTVKPRMGLEIEEYKKIYKAAQAGGIDIIEDDERLIDPKYCPFNKRVQLMGNMQKTGNTMYSANITGPLDKMIERLTNAYNAGLRFVKIDVMVTGFDALKSIADYIRANMNSEVAITCYPDAVGMYRNLSRKLVLKLSRLCGADIIYAGSPYWSRIEGSPNPNVQYKKNIHDISDKYKLYQVLRTNENIFKNIKCSLPTVSNDCNLSHAELVQKIFMRDFYNFFEYGLFVGGGISAFPAKLKDTVIEWIKCLEFTAKADPKSLEHYGYKYLDAMDEKCLTPFKLKEEIIG